MNQAIDGALAQLLNLSDNRLTDLFIRIREELFAQDKELILLVEDFATLAGIQGSLLDVVIREAIRALQSRGFLEIRRGTKGGAFVRELYQLPFMEDFADLIRFRRIRVDH